MSVTSELKAYQEARRAARSKPLQEGGGLDWGSAQTIMSNLQRDLHDLQAAVHGMEPVKVAFAFGLLLPQLERLADAALGTGTIKGLTAQGNKARDWGHAHTSGWSK